LKLKERYLMISFPILSYFLISIFIISNKLYEKKNSVYKYLEINYIEISNIIERTFGSYEMFNKNSSRAAGIRILVEEAAEASEDFLVKIN
jgi:hypothetical protein